MNKTGAVALKIIIQDRDDFGLYKIISCRNVS